MKREKFSEDMVAHFSKTYPEFTKESVRKAIKKSITYNGAVDAVTMHYYLVPKRFGGLGLGITNKRKLRKVNL